MYLKKRLACIIYDKTTVKKINNSLKKMNFELIVISYIDINDCIHKINHQNIDYVFVDIDIKNDYQKIVVITDDGCSACTNFFSTTMLDELDNVHTLFIVTSKGRSTDIKQFLQKKENVVVDWQMDINKYPEFSKTSAIFLGENRVDTIIKISAENVQEQIEFIRTNYRK